MRILPVMSRVESRESKAKTPGPRPIAAFTMVEIALSLAVIGIALVAILGVLPIGLRMQRENREFTLINQDATVLMEHIRNGAYGQNDLTNYIYAITNMWTRYKTDGVTVDVSDLNGYTDSAYKMGINGNGAAYYSDGAPINNGTNIIGLLTTPEFTDANGQPLPGIITNMVCFSNHMVAYIRSVSGAAGERPPQDNTLLRQSSFGYRVVCQNLPTPTLLPPEWQNTATYGRGDRVYEIQSGKLLYWVSESDTNTAAPGTLGRWRQDGYTGTLVSNSRELRLTFLWPQLPNGNVGNGRWTYRASVAGQLSMKTNLVPNMFLYFFQPQSFSTNAP